MSTLNKSVSFWPREHGAYAEVTFPLLTGLVLADLSLAPFLLAVATVAAFLAHEPIIVLSGGRGGRTREEFAGPALRHAAVLSTIAVVSGIFGLWFAPVAARIAALVPLALGSALIPLILTRREKTIPGETLVALAFATALIPVATAGGVRIEIASIAAGIWAVIFLLGTLTVHGIIAVGKRARSRAMTVFALIISALVIVAAVVLASVQAIPPLAALAAVPSALVALTFAALEIHPKHLRRLGWSMVASNVVALVVLLIGLS